jgi:murein DD-endopeptidase MepM/ murein hydrolase activator NlpD
VSRSFVRKLLPTTLLALAGLAPAAQAQSAFPTLEKGDRGGQVELVQRALTKYGIRTAADGVFGSRTATNVRRYERRERLAVDGRVSRGQARGMLRRAKMPTSLVDAPVPGDDGRPRAGATTRAATARFPVQGSWSYGDGFGERARGHDGVDVMAACGLPLVAPEAGRVVFRAQHSAAGHYVVVRVAGGEDHVFMHLRTASPLAKGATVEQGARLGEVGRTGNATACHLHFEIWSAPGWYEGGSARDPKPDLERWAGS